MDSTQSLQQTDHTEPVKQEEPQSTNTQLDAPTKDAAQLTDAAEKKSECKNPKKHKKNKSKRNKKGKKGDKTTDTSAEDDDGDSSSSSSSSSEDSSAEDAKGRHRGHRRHPPRKHGKGKGRRSKKQESSSDSSSNESDESESESSESEEESPPRRKKGKGRKSRREREEEAEEELEEEEPAVDDGADQIANNALMKQLAAMRMNANRGAARTTTGAYNTNALGTSAGIDWAKIMQGSRLAAGKDGKKRKSKGSSKKKKRRTGKRGSALEFKRVDQLWDSEYWCFTLLHLVQWLTYKALFTTTSSQRLPKTKRTSSMNMFSTFEESLTGKTNTRAPSSTSSQRFSEMPYRKS